MLKNRSVPADALLPHIIYQDLAEAIPWLSRAFGFSEHYRYGDPGSPDGAQMHLGDAWIMLKRARVGRESSPEKAGQRTHYLTVFVDDVDAHYEKVKAEGARIVEEINETCYGERQYGVEDYEGHHWLFSQHARDVNPDEWGATIAR